MLTLNPESRLPDSINAYHLAINEKIFMGTSSLNNKGRIYTFLDHTDICKLKGKYWNTTKWSINTETLAFILASLVTSGHIPSLHLDSLDPKYNHDFNEIFLILKRMVFFLFQIFLTSLAFCSLFIFVCF